MAGYVPPYLQPYGYMQPNQQMMAQQLPQPMPQMMTMPQMMQQPQQVQQPGMQGIVRVRGESAAKSWFVAPGNAVPMLDTEAPYLYINEVGADGVPKPLQKFRLINETEGAVVAEQASVQPAPEYALRTDMDGLIARITKLEEAQRNVKPGD